MNLDMLAEVRGPMSADSYAALIAVLGRNITGRVKDLRTFFEAGDLVKLARSAHDIKGSIGYFGAQGLAALAKELELTAPSGQATELAALIDRVEAAWPDILAILERP